MEKINNFNFFCFLISWTANTFIPALFILQMLFLIRNLAFIVYYNGLITWHDQSIIADFWKINNFFKTWPLSVCFNIHKSQGTKYANCFITIISKVKIHACYFRWISDRNGNTNKQAYNIYSLAIFILWK